MLNAGNFFVKNKMISARVIPSWWDVIGQKILKKKCNWSGKFEKNVIGQKNGYEKM